MASHSVVEIVVLVAAVALYFLPALLADRRKRDDLLVIALFNAVLGWTGIGWMLALFWALQPNPPEDLGAQTKERERRLGMGVFSGLLSRHIEARTARAADREGQSH
ncbi:superinfection immunity protein [Paraburkholderia dinghuensis]|uniref:Superinfection immunity protein n=1 Tax=Paraburkholderia dinghuensis TaxID=2305225 RepID=A0A3N6N4P8_9BURK|nr:superinfection immunity protein [Paraburkholderia dinghuensis]RQH02757.1 superinfection immunity protein [Paraburkholderia dinghuensis]